MALYYKKNHSCTHAHTFTHTCKRTCTIYNSEVKFFRLKRATKIRKNRQQRNTGTFCSLALLKRPRGGGEDVVVLAFAEMELSSKKIDDFTSRLVHFRKRMSMFHWATWSSHDTGLWGTPRVALKPSEVRA